MALPVFVLSSLALISSFIFTQNSSKLCSCSVHSSCRRSDVRSWFSTLDWQKKAHLNMMIMHSHDNVDALSVGWLPSYLNRENMNIFIFYNDWGIKVIMTGTLRIHFVHWNMKRLVTALCLWPIIGHDAHAVDTDTQSNDKDLFKSFKLMNILHSFDGKNICIRWKMESLIN